MRKMKGKIGGEMEDKNDGKNWGEMKGEKWGMWKGNGGEVMGSGGRHCRGNEKSEVEMGKN